MVLFYIFLPFFSTLFEEFFGAVFFVVFFEVGYEVAECIGMLAAEVVGCGAYIVDELVLVVVVRVGDLISKELE